MASIGRFLGSNLASLGSHFDHIFDNILGSVLDCVLEVQFEGFLGPKATQAKARGAQRRHKVAFLLLFTMVSACCLFCCFQVLGLLLVPFWCQLGLLKRPSGPQDGCQNLSKVGPKMGSKNDRHLGGSLGGVLGSRHRARG